MVITFSITNRQSGYNFRLIVHNNYVDISCSFRDRP